MSHDLIVIGTGPGGYVCAIRAAQLGMRVAVVEKRATHGGTCLNVGCIPSKALLFASERYEEAGHAFAGMGIDVKPKLEPVAGGAAGSIEADVVLVAIGRIPYTEGLGLAEAGIRIDDKKRIVVDERFETSVPGIYAIGDVIRGLMLAHKAEDEGIAIAEILAGEVGHVNYDVIPNVIYTAPEVAAVGKSEEELKDAGIAYNAGKFPFTANGRAQAGRESWIWAVRRGPPPPPATPIPR